MSLTLITGGARSGKSTFAEELTKKMARWKYGTPDKGVLYIATAVPFDEEMQERIRRHQLQRPNSWRTVEQFEGLQEVIRTAQEQVILLDCVTVMISNLLFAGGLGDEPELEQVQRLEQSITLEIRSMLEAIQIRDECEVIVVTNELGMGLVPAYPLGRIFRDIAGRVNQQIAAASDAVYLVVSGIPVLIKGEGDV